jgi:hypothetical protein
MSTTYQVPDTLISAADDRKATLLRSIHRISCMASDYRTVYTDAVKRVIERERKQQ